MKEILQSQRYSDCSIFALDAWIHENNNFLNKHQGEIHIISQSEMQSISTLQSPSACLAILPFVESTPDPPREGLWALYLDGLQDPGNVGTILRTMDWFGVHQVFLPEGTIDVYNPKLIQATMGSFLRVKYQTCTPQECVSMYNKCQWIAADLKGIPPSQINIKIPTVLIIGSESHGISETWQPYINQYVHIPGHIGQHAESLNAAVSAGILCYALIQN